MFNIYYEYISGSYYQAIPSGFPLIELTKIISDEEALAALEA